MITSSFITFMFLESFEPLDGTISTIYIYIHIYCTAVMHIDLAVTVLPKLVHIRASSVRIKDS